MTTSTVATPAGYRRMTSRYDGKCAVCQTRFTAGTEIVYCYETRKAQCSDMSCRSERRVANPDRRGLVVAQPVSVYSADIARDAYEAAAKSAMEDAKSAMEDAQAKAANLRTSYLGFK